MQWQWNYWFQSSDVNYIWCEKLHQWYGFADISSSTWYGNRKSWTIMNMWIIWFREQGGDLSSPHFKVSYSIRWIDQYLYFYQLSYKSLKKFRANAPYEKLFGEAKSWCQIFIAQNINHKQVAKLNVRATKQLNFDFSFSQIRKYSLNF